MPCPICDTTGLWRRDIDTSLFPERQPATCVPTCRRARRGRTGLDRFQSSLDVHPRPAGSSIGPISTKSLYITSNRFRQPQLGFFFCGSGGTHIPRRAPLVSSSTGRYPVRSPSPRAISARRSAKIARIARNPASAWLGTTIDDPRRLRARSSHRAFAQRHCEDETIGRQAHQFRFVTRSPRTNAAFRYRQVVQKGNLPRPCSHSAWTRKTTSPGPAPARSWGGHRS